MNKLFTNYSSLRKTYAKLTQKLLLTTRCFNYSIISQTQLNDFLFNHLKDEISQWDEYNRAEEAVKSQSELVSHIDNLIGTQLGAFILKLDAAILVFASWVLWGKDEFDQEDFDSKFDIYINFFKSSTIDLYQECRIFNFSSTLQSIQLGKGLSISRKPPFSNINDISFYDRISLSEYVVLQHLKLNKIIRCPKTGEVILGAKKEITPNVRLTFENVARAIKVLKHSGCYLNNTVKQYWGGFLESYGGQSHGSVFRTISFGEKCNFDEGETESLREVYNQIVSSDKKVQIGINRLKYATERNSDEDKVIDCFIGLESIFLKSDNTEVTFKISLRIAKTLESIPEKQQELFDFIKRMYKVRSKVAHGNEVKLISIDIKRLEDVLRRSVRLYLKNKALFENEYLESKLFSLQGMVNISGNY